MKQEFFDERLAKVEELIGNRPGGLVLTRYDESSNLVMVDSLIKNRHVYIGPVDMNVFFPNPGSPVVWSAEFEQQTEVGKTFLKPYFYMNRESGVRILFPVDKDEQFVISMDRKYKLPTRFAYRQIESNGDFLLDEVHIEVAGFGYISYQVDGERFSFIPADKEKKILELTKDRAETIGKETTVKICEIEEENGQINLTIEVKMKGEKMQRLTFQTPYNLPKLDDVKCPDQFDLSKLNIPGVKLLLNYDLIGWNNSILIDYIRQNWGKG